MQELVVSTTAEVHGNCLLCIIKSAAAGPIHFEIRQRNGKPARDVIDLFVRPSSLAAMDLELLHI